MHCTLPFGLNDFVRKILSSCLVLCTILIFESDGSVEQILCKYATWTLLLANTLVQLQYVVNLQKQITVFTNVQNHIYCYCLFQII